MRSPATNTQTEQKLAALFSGLLRANAAAIADQVARLYEETQKLAKADDEGIPPERPCVDFDGVLSNTRGHAHDPTVFDDAPVTGSLDGLAALIETGLRPYIFTARLAHGNQESIIAGMREWFLRNDFPVKLLDQLEFTAVKPPDAGIYIDDLGRGFDGPGTFPSVQEVTQFRSWIERRGVLRKAND